MEKEATFGICSLCGMRKAKAVMSRHLQTCAPGHDAPSGGKSALIQMRAEPRYGGLYWVDLEMKADAMLGELDYFLRHLWLECCGHMSAFEINGSSYVDNGEGFGLDPPEQSMDHRVGRLLVGPGERFRYEYDFGSTTELVLRVWGRREGLLGKSALRLLARNEAPVWPCKVCGQPATLICRDCSARGEGFYCADHQTEDAPDHEDSFLPVVNSPRMGVCGYSG
jgi:hypothetical protein